MSTVTFDGEPKVSDLTVRQFRNLWITSAKSDLMTPEGVAAETGYALATIYTMVHKREIPYYKNKTGGNKLHFSRKEIEEWALHRRVRTIEEEIEYDKQMIGKRRRNNIKN